jgi:hypothetical protein
MPIWGLEKVSLLIKLYANLSMKCYRQLIIEVMYFVIFLRPLSVLVIAYYMLC